jgi:hypothetical protein
MVEILESTGFSFTTSDALGIGGLLTDASRLLQVIAESRKGPQGTQCTAINTEKLLFAIIDDAERSLAAYSSVEGIHLRKPAEHRLAFRELGLSIGIHAIEVMQRTLGENVEVIVNQGRLEQQLKVLMDQYRDLGPRIETFWLNPTNRATEIWKAHEDINTVMLSTSLDTEGFLVLPPRAGGTTSVEESSKRKE